MNTQDNKQMEAERDADFDAEQDYLDSLPDIADQMSDAERAAKSAAPQPPVAVGVDERAAFVKWYGDDAPDERDVSNYDMAKAAWQARAALAATPSDGGAGAAPELTVTCLEMPETNGKTNYTAVLHRKDQTGLDMFSDGYTLMMSEYPDRVRYEADFMLWLIGVREAKPELWDSCYDMDKHSGYIEPAASAPASTNDEAEEDAYVIDRMGKLLAGVAVALKGPEAARHRHGYQDLPELAEKMALELALFREREAAASAPAAAGVVQIADYFKRSGGMWIGSEVAEQIIKLSTAPASAPAVPVGQEWTVSHNGQTVSAPTLTECMAAARKLRTPEEQRVATENLAAAIRAGTAEDEAEMRAARNNVLDEVAAAFRAHPTISRQFWNVAAAQFVESMKETAPASEPRTGTCGSDDPRALCNFVPPQPVEAEPVAWSIKHNGKHVGNVFGERAKAYERKRHLDDEHHGKREVVPLVEQSTPPAALVDRNKVIEECARVCDSIEEDRWSVYKGHGAHTGADGRADTRVQGESDGAGLCAAAIRALKKGEEDAKR